VGALRLTDGIGVQPLIGDRVVARCPRCGGPLCATGDKDWGLCMTHGEQYIGPFKVDLPETPRAGRKRRTVAEVDALNRADFEASR
jgi:hypothetical protein